MPDTINDSATSLKNRSARINWIDDTRGFVIFNTTLFWFMPKSLKDQIPFLAAHPKGASSVDYMNYYDIGTIAYIVIMGIALAISYNRRSQNTGHLATVKHLIVRYGLILLLSLLLEPKAFTIIESGDKYPIPLIRWGIFPSLGVVGLLAILSTRLSFLYQTILGLLLLASYQWLLLSGDGIWRDYASSARHSGIIATVLAYHAAMLIGMAMGNYLFTQKDKKPSEIKTLFLGGAAFLALGYLLSFIPELYPNKKQATSTFVLIAIGVVFASSGCFATISALIKRPLPIISSYGKNIIFVFAILMGYLFFDDALESLSSWTIFAIMVGSITAVVVALDKKGIILKI